MHCLICDQEIFPILDWKQLFVPEKSKPLCDGCDSKLELLSGKRCKKCSRNCIVSICPDCEQWEKMSGSQGELECNQSVYRYNSMIQEIIANWKYRGDYILCEIFRDSFKNRFQTNFDFLKKTAVLVPIPLSPERMLERGFNQAEALVQLLDLPYMNALTRLHGEKQSKKTRKQRLSSQNPFEVITSINQPVILIDDIYTTGITLRHAARQLKLHGSPSVYAFTLIRG
ncbi:ComF family protein [Radiobacillus sp. PE A8.2]|uniref:ComF family protein n=1 Tax=Radiobacillus sp. PE A8.2 TaxID=3380349 RepID=UPI003890CBBC